MGNAHNHTPDLREVEAVETSLYNRMFSNAAKGFIKAAVIAAMVGFVIGGLVATGMAAGVLPMALTHLTGAAVTEGSIFLAGGLHLAAIFGGVAGSFGAVAGIQSTRDTRRYFMLHENDGLEGPADNAMHAVAPSLSPQISLSQKPDHFQAMLKTKACDNSPSLNK